MEELRSKCKYDYDWNVGDVKYLKSVNGVVQAKYGCRPDLRTCKACDNILLHYDMTKDHINTHIQIKTLTERCEVSEKQVKQLNKRLQELEDLVRRLTSLSSGEIVDSSKALTSEDL